MDKLPVLSNYIRFVIIYIPGPSCSKLTTSLVNESLKFTSSDTQICWNFLLKNVSSFCNAKATQIFSAKNIRLLFIKSAKTVNEMTLNELVKLTTLWTTGPSYLGTITYGRTKGKNAQIQTHPTHAQSLMRAFARMRWLIWAFVIRICQKTRSRIARTIYYSRFWSNFKNKKSSIFYFIIFFFKVEDFQRRFNLVDST